MVQDNIVQVSLLEAWTLLSMNSIVLDKAQIDLLERYHRELVHWNNSVNLVSRKDVDFLIERHLIHSLMLLRYVEFPHKARVLDLGTGGGLPGLPIKIARQDLRVTLVDSIAKKIKIVDMMARHTGLKDLDAVRMRVEDMATISKYKSAFNVIVSRAVAPLKDLAHWSGGVRAPGAVLAVLKGGNLTDEISEFKTAFPNVSVIEHDINVHGLPWFLQENKKVVECRFS